MQFLGRFKIATALQPPPKTSSPVVIAVVVSPPPSPPQSTSPHSSPYTTTAVDPPTTPEPKPASRWWHETRFNARSHLTKQRRLGSDPSSSVKVETGTAGGGGISRNH